MPLTSYIKRIAKQWAAHDNTRSAAAIGFYAVFTLAPMLVFATAGLGLFVGQKQAQSLTAARFEEAIGPTGAEIAHEVLVNADFSNYGSLTTTVSVLVLIYGASSIFFQLRNVLDQIFGRPQRTSRAALISTLLSRVVAALSVVLATTLLVATLISEVVLHSISDELWGGTGFSETAWKLTSTFTSVVVVSLVILVLLRFLPSHPPGWLHVLKGAVVSVLLFELGKWLFGMYISKSAIASAYGPSSTIVAFILWIYYSAQIFILGAEVCKISADGEQA
jgi:membrane protein